MNRIVWVMGQSAAGKETFIRNAVSHPNCELMKQLGFKSSKIIPIGDNISLGDYERIEIKDMVLDILKKETDATIFIKWQHVDTDPQYGDLIMKLKIETPDISNEIVLLSVESGVLYARLQKNWWWNESTSSTQEEMDHVVEILRGNVKKWLDSGFVLAAEIDATDEYNRNFNAKAFLRSRLEK